MYKKWIYTKETGQLYIEEILLMDDVPIFFVCKNEKKLFLVETIDEEEGVYLISETQVANVLDMLLEKITIREAILQNESVYITKYLSSEQEFYVDTVFNKDISDEYLPIPNSYFELKNENIKRYIKELHNDLLEQQALNIELSNQVMPRIVYVNVSMPVRTNKIIKYDSAIKVKSDKKTRGKIYKKQSSGWNKCEISSADRESILV